MNFYFSRGKKQYYLFTTRKIKIHIFKPLCNFSFFLYGQEYFCTNNSVRVGNDVIDILTSEDMEKFCHLSPGCSFV